MKKIFGIASLAILALAGCQASRDVQPIHSGGIIGLRYDPEDPANGNQSCWRVTFTAKGQTAYDCADKAQWQDLKLGDWYTANGLPAGEK